MATYPNTDYDVDATRVTPRESVTTDTSDGGTVRGVVKYAGEIYDITLVHKYILEAEAAVIESFYTANKALSVDVTWRGATYNCVFTGKPEASPSTGIHFTVTSRLVGNRSDGG